MTYHYLKEDGSGALLEEDGVGYYLLQNSPGTISGVLSQAPLNFTRTLNSFISVTLGWTPIKSSLVMGYAIWRNGVIFATVVGNSVGSYIDSSVVAGKHYLYAVSALDLSQNFSPQTPTLRADVPPAANLTFESVYQEQPGEGGYPDILWRWQ